MGKSSSQVVGYRYCAKFTAFIGNRIEKLIAINFDNRKWIIHDPLKHPPNLLPVLENNLFGENEGGVSGNVDIHFGTPDQEPNEVYQQYLPLVSGYPYQSYLLFRGITSVNQFTGAQTTAPGFYLGNSGYMKEMLLWVKRIHVKNNGDMQWYDLKAEIDGSNYFTPLQTSTYQDFQVLKKLSMYWADKDGVHNRAAGSASFPMTEIRKGFESDIGENGPQIPEIPGYIAASELLSNNGVSIILDNMTIIPEPTWTNYPPTTDGFWDGAIVRIYTATGSFFWTGGVFQYRAFLSNNFSAIIISDPKDHNVIANIEPTRTKDAYQCIEGEVYIPPGKYNIRAEVGERYATQGTPRPFVHFQVKAMPYDEPEGPDINPIHKIREILTDDTAMGKPETDVNDANFMKAADRIYDEGLGVSWAIDEKSCIEAIEELCYHIEAGIRVNRQTGLYEMVLFRDDWFAEDEIHNIAESKIKDISLEVMNSDDIVNQLNVTYYDRARIKNSTFSVYENGSILTMGHANAESVEFPYFMNMRNAEIMANWKLKQFSTPAWSGSFATGWKEARKWNRYDLIRLPWSKKWNGTILVRIMKINLGNGTDNTVTIDFEEVIPYSGEMNTSIVVDESAKEGVQPPRSSVNAVFEAPYYLTVLRAGQTNTDLQLSKNPESGYVAAIAAKPQNNSLNALLYTDGGGGEFERVSRLDYCDILQLDQPITETTSSFVVTRSLTQTANSSNLILLNDELMAFVAFNEATKVLTVKRGVLDTVPKKHSSGPLFVFDLPDVAFDSTQYSYGEIVEAQVLTTTPSGVMDLNESGAPVEIQARAIRPYPPANVKINGEYWPVEIETDLVITWVDRNRTQQTGGTPLGWFDEGVVIESGVTTHLRLTQYDKNQIELATNSANVSGTNTFTFPISSMQADTQTVEITLKTTRDGFDCLSPFVYTIELSTFYSAPYDITYIVSDL